MIAWNIAIVFVGSLLLGFLLVVSVPSLGYPSLFVISVVLAVIIGFSTPRQQRHPSESRSAGASTENPPLEGNNTEKTHHFPRAVKVRAVGGAIAIIGSLLAASTMLYIGLDFALLKEFCVSTYGAVGDLKIDDNDYCNYDYGKMVKFFIRYLLLYLAPFVVFVVLTVMLRAIRFSFFPFVKNWMKKHQ